MWCSSKANKKKGKKDSIVKERHDTIHMHEIMNKMRQSNFKEEMIAKCLVEIRCSVKNDEIFLRKEFNIWLSAWELARTYNHLEKQNGDVTAETLADALKEQHITFILNDRILNKFEEVLLDDVMSGLPSNQIDNAMEIARKVKKLNEIHKADHDESEDEDDVEEEYWRVTMKEEDIIMKKIRKSDSKGITMRKWVINKIHK